MDITWYDYGNNLRQMGCYNPFWQLWQLWFFLAHLLVEHSGTAPTSFLYGKNSAKDQIHPIQ
jgi:hypothetical protein